VNAYYACGRNKRKEFRGAFRGAFVRSPDVPLVARQRKKIPLSVFLA